MQEKLSFDTESIISRLEDLMAEGLSLPKAKAIVMMRFKSVSSVCLDADEAAIKEKWRALKSNIEFNCPVYLIKDRNPYSALVTRLTNAAAMPDALDENEFILTSMPAFAHQMSKHSI